MSDSSAYILQFINRRNASWSRSLAARCALRLLPLFQAQNILIRDSVNESNDLVKIFRSLIVSYSVSLGPVNDVSRGAANAATSSLKEITERNSSSIPLLVIYFASRAAGRSDTKGDFQKIISLISSMDDAEIKNDIFREMNNDIAFLENTNSVKAKSKALMEEPLWLSKNSPDWFDRELSRFFSTEIVKNFYFLPWLNLYLSFAKIKNNGCSGQFIELIAFQPDIWWRRSAALVNRDIERLLNTSEDALPLIEIDIKEVISLSPEPSPAPARFIIDNDSIQTMPLPNDGDMAAAQDFLDELRRKAQRLLNRLQLSNAEPQVRDAVTDLLDALPPHAAELRPRIVLSRATGVEACAGAFASSRGELELFEGAVAQVYDVAATSRLLLACFPLVLEIEAAAAQLLITPANAAAVADHLDDIRAKAAESPVVGDSANAALDEQAGSTAKLAQQPEGHAKQTARYALTIRNFLTPVVRFAVAAGFEATTEATGVGKEIWAKAKPKLIESAADGLGAMGKPVVVSGVAALVAGVAGPVAGLAALAAGFGKIDQFMKLAEKYLLTKYGQKPDDGPR